MLNLDVMMCGLEDDLVFQSQTIESLTTIRAVLLYDADAELPCHCFYVCPWDKLPPDGPSLPKGAYLALSEVPTDIPDSDGAKRLPNTLGFSLSTATLLNRLSINLHKFEEFTKQLRRLDNLQQIADCTCSIAGCPVSIVNSFFEGLACSDPGSAKSEIFRQLLQDRKFQYATAQDLLACEKASFSTDKIRFPSGMATVTDYPIRYNTKVITRILAEYDSPENERRCFPYVDEMLKCIRPQVLANDTLRNMEKDQINMLISDILDRNLTDTEEIEQKLSMSLHSFKGKCYQPVVIKFKKRADNIPVNYISGQLTSIFPSSVVISYNRSLLILCAKEKFDVPLDYNKKAFMDLLEEFNAHAAIGETTRYLTSLRILYIQAAAATRLGNTFCRDKKCRIYYYRDYSIYFLVDLCVDDVIKRHKFGNVSYLCDPEVIGLLRYDRKYGTHMEETLRCYLNSSRNAKLCAETMGVHRNTIINRIKFIEEAFGAPLSEPNMYFNALFSLKIIDYQREYIEQDPLDMVGKIIDDKYWDAFISVTEKQ